ncbi:protein ACCELERATED CELL DEATH 6 [Eucalyptus grandis]|uniref:protein ACCELERATED CELL DEATH 6 n=1 Tax=Eucalyptus grandis TaxID=71139 RepID=UPI00192E9182|nr:protein ACCELERATED CELL DEATH 6 [Eucalyptus grandis]
MDVNLSIDEQEMWEQRKLRLEALIRANPSQQRHNPARRAQIMDPLLYLAAKEGDVDKFIKALEDHCAREGVSLPVTLEQLSPSGNTLLHAVAGSDDILRALIDFVPGHLISRGNSRRERPLHIAARAGKTGAVELLLSRANPRVPDISGNSPLHEAVRNRHYEVIRQLTSKDPYLLFLVNRERKTPGSVAVETGDLNVLKLLLEAMLALWPDLVEIEICFGMPPAHVAVEYQNMDMLTEMWNKMPVLLLLIDEQKRNPLHLAAYTNYLDGVKFMIEKLPLSALQQDGEGYLPIHVACKMDHVRIVEELQQLWPDPAEFRDGSGENILHVSARYGCISTVRYILKSPQFADLINARDIYLNTPLHLATLHWQPSVLLLLSRDGRVDLKLVNADGKTALDVAEEAITEIDAPLQKSEPKERKGPPALDRLKEERNTRMLVATLVAGMTFASSIQVPGGYNSSDQDAGIAILLHKAMYNVFVICNCIAMHSSIIALVILLWTQINDPFVLQNALSKSRLTLLVALEAMLLAFMAGVYVSVTELAWLAIVVLVLGSVALFIILSFYLLLHIPLGCKHPLVRRFTDLIIVVGISMSGSVTAGSRTITGYAIQLWAGGHPEFPHR